MIQDVLREADLGLEDLDAIAYTAGPGLIGALLGRRVARVVARLWPRDTCDPGASPRGTSAREHARGGAARVPILGSARVGWPHPAHRGHGARPLQDHRRDARRRRGRGVRQGRALLGLPYPGGPELAKLADSGSADRFALPRPLKNQGLDFSFSGLKTAARHTIEAERSADGRLDERREPTSPRRSRQRSSKR